MWARCSGPAWQRDDFSRCFQRDYLQLLIPLLATALSLVYIIIYLSLRVFKDARRKRKNVEEQPQLNGARPLEGHEPFRDALPRENEEPSNERGLQTYDSSPESKISEALIQINKPRGQVTLVVLEFLLAAAIFALYLSDAIASRHRYQHLLATLPGLICWAYILFLIFGRFWGMRRPSRYLPNLWYQTASLYLVQWILSVLLFRSAIIHPRSDRSRSLAIANFVFTSVLVLIAATARRGNKTIALEYEAELEPSHEPLASIISAWTYGWVDEIVWKGFKHPLEMKDVWNLAVRDKAATVLANYRQVKKTNALAWHLVKYFKKELIIQSSWACISGLFTFAPTLLLKVFLEFVEDPKETPINAAWFYIILLGVTSCIKAITDGQALWVGRKVCIRLRAIIVGEVYAKALRRRAASAKNAVLGEQKESGKNAKDAVVNGNKHEANKSNADDGQSDSQASVGTIINLMAVDSFKVSEISAYLHFLWGTTPVQFIICIALLYKILGLSSLAGIVMMILVLPINLFIAKQFTKTQKKVMAATDVRIHTTNEILQNIRIIKYFAWEQRFASIVGDKRRVELRALRNKYILWTAAAGIWFGVPVLITFFSFLLYTVVEKRPLVPSVAFTALSLFGILRYPLDQLADMVAHVQESKVSIDRVEEYLNEDETSKYDQLVSQDARTERSEPVIGLENATLSWGGKDGKSSDGQVAFRLIGMQVRFSVGHLNIIAGPTGSGKTSLLMALLGEMTLSHGSVHLPYQGNRQILKPDPETLLTESVAYCAQQAWLINDTIKENILFASPFDEPRYRAVLSACALERDLQILDDGDSTLVGEKGITLSGGQKQRISLARALYSNARHVLLDDCLSAVDSHTAKHIFEFCILGPLMTGRTCILVTHNVALCVPRSKYVVVLANGKIANQGTADDVIASGILGDEVLRSRPGSKGTSKLHTPVSSSISLDAKANDLPNGSGKKSDSQPNGGPKDAAKTMDKQDKDKLRTEEKATGSVNWDVIKMYMLAMGPWYYWLLALGGFAVQQVGSVGGNVWIRAWANAYSQKIQSSDVTLSDYQFPNANLSTMGISLSSSLFPKSGPFWNLPLSTGPSGPKVMAMGDDDIDPWYYLSIYAVLGVAFVVVSLIREALIFWGSLRASASLHRKLFDAVTRAKLQFFDITPLGQIMNRFSKDIEAIDQDVSPVAVGALGCLFSLVSIVLLICAITPRFLIAAVFIAAIYTAIGAFYIRSSRDLKRLESIQRSPIYQHFGETLSGVVTIRAYGDEKRFIRDNELRVDTHNRPFIYLWATNRWLALRVDFAGALVAFFAGVFILLSIDTIDAGSAGLSLTYAVMFTENVLWLVRLYSANEQNMNSVERMKEYMEVEQEAAAVVEDHRPPSGWPSRGAVEFVHYSTRYRADLDPVLRDLNFDIAPGERVGIVGRTGAGKSSLALALFRGLEAETGQIMIDDVDIGRLGLQDLRESITIVPQDPTLFTGTIRSNLDPFGLFTDEEIFSVLRKVQLIDSSQSIVNLPATSAVPGILFEDVSTHLSPTQTRASEGEDLSRKLTNTRGGNTNIFLNLNSDIAESGSNLSQGQRQLLCLARALLKAPRVLVMDEATASIDYATDNKIQDTLREVKESTIITIAHRLQTIIDYDKVLVLDKGRLIEYDAPWKLIKQSESIFRGMCEMSGDLEGLLDAAKEAERKKSLIDV